MKRIFKVGNENLEFKMTNKTIFDIDEKFDNFSDVINGLMYGQKLYNNALKVMVCSCISERFDKYENKLELSVEELIEKLNSDQIVKEIVPFATDIYLDYRGIKASTEDENENAELDDKKK